MIDAIVYTSNTGFTAEYAGMLGKNTGLPVYSLDEAKKKLPQHSAVIYLGWLMASNVKGYKEAAKLYDVKAVCGVGMGGNGSQLAEVAKANALPADMPLFTLQGGFDMNRLHGMNKLLMKMMKAMLGGRLEKKSDRTPEDDAMLDMLKNNTSYVSEKNLAPVLDWYGKNK